MTLLLAFLGYLLALSAIVALHELGHYLAARSAGIPCREFAVGMGPKLFSRRFAGTEWSVRAFLIGGFVDLDDAARTATHPLKRCVVDVAGCAMNLLTAWVLVFSILAFQPHAVGIETEVAATDAAVWSAEMTGQAFVAQGEAIVATAAAVLPGEPSRAAQEAPKLAGPVGVASFAIESARGGLATSLWFLAVISAALAFFNLLPVPFLDGGHLVRDLWAAVRRRRKCAPPCAGLVLTSPESGGLDLRYEWDFGDPPANEEEEIDAMLMAGPPITDEIIALFATRREDSE